MIMGGLEAAEAPRSDKPSTLETTVGAANVAALSDFNCKDHAGPMWQGGLAAGKPSVPWYQIHVRGIPGWRACRRPQARPPRFVQGDNGERS